MTTKVKKEENIPNITEAKAKDIIIKKSTLNVDNAIIFIIKEIFCNNTNEDVKFPNISRKRNKNEYNLIVKFIDLMNVMFEYDIEKRDKIYKSPVKSIKYNELINIISAIDKYIKNVELNSLLKNKKMLYDLYLILSKKIKPDKKENDLKMIELIDQIILALGFILKNNTIIKFITFKMIKYHFLKDKEKKKIDFPDCLINVENEICLNMIIDLFNDKFENGTLVLISYVILRFESVQPYIKTYDFTIIKETLQNCIHKIKNRYPSDFIITVETLIILFIEEYENLNNNNKDEKEIKIQPSKEKISANNDINDEEGVNTKNNNDNIQSTSGIIFNHPPTPKKGQNEIIDKNKENNEINTYNFDYKNIIENIKILLNKIKMEPQQNEELKNIFKTLIDQMKLLEGSNANLNSEILKLKEQLNSVNGEVNKLNGEVNILKDQNIKLNEDIVKLNNQNDEIKNILGKIQIREQGKRFLKSFNQYLNKKDLDEINDLKKAKTNGVYKKIFDIIRFRLEEAFDKFKNTEKFKLVINLTEKVCASLDKGNSNAHSLTMEIYQDNIDKYKDSKNIFSLSSPHLFCFLIGIDLKNDFDNSYSFLEEYFDKDLQLKSWRINTLKSYFTK